MICIYVYMYLHVHACIWFTSIYIHIHIYIYIYMFIHKERERENLMRYLHTDMQHTQCTVVRFPRIAYALFAAYWLQQMYVWCPGTWFYMCKYTYIYISLYSYMYIIHIYMYTNTNMAFAWAQKQTGRCHATWMHNHGSIEPSCCGDLTGRSNNPCVWTWQAHKQQISNR